MDTHPDENTSRSKVDKILAEVARVLGSVESPDFRRIKFDARRYARLIEALSDGFWIRDISDPNADISSVLLLRSALTSSNEEYIIFISNVVDYYFTMKLDEATSINDTNLETITALIAGDGLEALSKEILSTPVKTKTFYSDRPRLFNIIFTDADYLPWESVDRPY